MPRRRGGLRRYLGHPGLVLVALLTSWPAWAQTGALSSWNDGVAKSRIVAFVEAVTDRSSKDYVPPADRIAVFMEGHIAQVGTPREVFAKPQTMAVAAFVGTPQMNLIPGTWTNDVVTVDGQAIGGTLTVTLAGGVSTPTLDDFILDPLSSTLQTDDLLAQARLQLPG